MCATNLAIPGLEEAAALLSLVHDCSCPELVFSCAILYLLVDCSPALPAPCSRCPPALERHCCHGNAESSESPAAMPGREELRKSWLVDSKPSHSLCTLLRSGVWLQLECGRWVAYLPL